MNLQESEKKIERYPSKENQEEITPEKNKSFVEEIRNIEDGANFFLGGKDVISLSYAL